MAVSKKAKETIGLITAIIVLIGLVFGVYFWLEKRYALAEEMKKIEQRLDYKILADQLQAIQERIWQIMDRFKNREMDQTVQEELRVLEMQKEQKQNQIKMYEQKVP